MFGYLRPLESELLVKEQELYRAVYCGLCTSMQKKVSRLCALSLNYDFVFLALLRAELCGETFSFCQKRCPVHPLKKRNCATPDAKILEFTAKIHLALTYENLRDDLCDPDTPFWRRGLVCLYLSGLSLRVRKLKKQDEEFAVVLTHAANACRSLYSLEQSGCTDVDELAHVCAEGIARACCVGLSGQAERLMYAAASNAGRLIYLLDACDDLEKDAEKGSFNPFLARYGSLSEAIMHLDEINTALSLYARELNATVNLIAAPARYGSLCENISRLGIPAIIRGVIRRYEQTEQEERIHA